MVPTPTYPMLLAAFTAASPMAFRTCQEPHDQGCLGAKFAEYQCLQCLIARAQSLHQCGCPLAKHMQRVSNASPEDVSSPS